MLKLMFFVCFFAYFCVIKCDGNFAQVNVILGKASTVNHEKYCKVEIANYNLTLGTIVQIIIKDEIKSAPTESVYIQKILANNIYHGFQTKEFMNISKIYTINDVYTDYELQFIFTWNGGVLKKCSTTVHYEIPDNGVPCALQRNEIITFIVIGVLCVIVIIAETILILYCRSKFIALSRHNNLTRLKEEDMSDGDRYSSNPKKQDKNFTPMIPVDNRQSEIYEEPNIGIGAPPPLPPGIPSSRSDHSNTSTLKMPHSPQANGTSYPTFPRTKHLTQEPLPTIPSVADRPRHPLPDDCEFYSEAVEDEMYEQPPIVLPQQAKKALPPTPKQFIPSPQQLTLPNKPTPQQKQFLPAQKPLPTPQKQFTPPQKQVPPAQKQLPPPQKQFPPPQKQFPPPPKQESSQLKPFSAPQKQNPPTTSLKTPNSQTRAIQEQLAAKLQLDKSVKPPISQAKPTPPRNKTTVPAAARMPSPPAPKPQPTVKLVSKPPAAKPKTPPMSPTLEQQVQFFNQHRDDLPHNYSSDDDDEWTYEPLYNI